MLAIMAGPGGRGLCVCVFESVCVCVCLCACVLVHIKSVCLNGDIWRRMCLSVFMF